MKKKYKDMTEWEKLEHDNKKADRISNLAICISIITIVMNIIASLD